MAKGGWKEVEREVTTVEAYWLQSNAYDISKENDTRNSDMIRGIPAMISL